MALGTVESVWLELDGQRVALHVLELGLACCGVEMRAARRMVDGAVGLVACGGSDAAGEPDPPGEALHVLVVAGTVTTRLAPVLTAAAARVPQPRAVLAFGACTATGGPYWDSYCVVPGAHELLPVDVWVPGCPPRPADLVAGLREVLRARA
jgi:NADH-quinone oxidoreductase subunit B